MPMTLSSGQKVNARSTYVTASSGWITLAVIPGLFSSSFIFLSQKRHSRLHPGATGR
jgi:hypothetical protein